jgi:hypothetical protein
LYGDSLKFIVGLPGAKSLSTRAEMYKENPSACSDDMTHVFDLEKKKAACHACGAFGDIFS